MAMPEETPASRVKRRSWPRFRRYLKALARRRSHRRDYRHLLSFNEHDLRDIGLTRHDIEQVLSRPVDWRNH